MAALRGPSHLHHLFVAADRHRRGIGERLWRHARAAALARGPVEAFTVVATEFGLPFSRRQGFRPDGPIEEVFGRRHQRLRLEES
ncbi:MAG: GNAT family N-acetyltransferase [Planctomycetota bacterium]|nr:MAG: GNAT family N-acetyltransferase [Planctomycetota bacterium]